MKKIKGRAFFEATWMLFFVISVTYGSAAEIEYVKIGGIFDAEDGSTQELAFKMAVDFVNSVEENLPGRMLVAKTEKVSQVDSYSVSKVICKMIKEGVVGIFDPTIGPASRHVQSICAIKDVPYIKTSMDVDQDKTSNLINVYPHPAILSKVFADLAEAMEWKQFTILYENSQSLISLRGLFKHSYDDKRKVTFKQFDYGTGNYRSILQNAKKSGETNFVLECSTTEKLYDVLLQAQQIGLLIERYSFIVTTPDLHTMELEPFVHGGANITGIRLTDPENEAVLSTVGFWNSSNKTLESESLDPDTIKTDVAMIMDAVFAFATGLRDINTKGRKSIDCDQEGRFEQGPEIVDKIKNIPVLGLTGLNKFDESGFRTDFSLNIIELSFAGIEKIGTWDSITNTLNLTKHEQLSEHSNNSSDKKLLTVLISLNAPYGMLKESTKALHGNDRFEGFAVDIIDKMSQMLDFNYELVLQEDGFYGSFNKYTNQWNGMIRSIMDWEADLAITDLTITTDRLEVVDFTTPFMNLGISILYQKPELMQADFFFFLTPFSCEVWLYIGVAFLGVSLLLFVMARLAPKEWKKPNPCNEKSDQLENQFGLLNSLWFTGASVVQQRSGYSPMAISTRMVASLWWFFTLIIVCFYIANLVSILTIDTFVSQIDSVDDLVNNKKGITYGALRNGATVEFFKNSDNPMYNQMYEYMMNNPESLSASTSEGIERVKSENYAFLMESSTIEYVTQRNCDVTQIGGLLTSKGHGIAMRKNSPYRYALSSAILKMQEDGTLSNLKRKWWNEKRGGGVCDVADDYIISTGAELGLDRMRGLFSILFVGCITAVIVACIEMICGVVKNSHKHKIPFRQELAEEWRAVAQCGKNTKPVTYTTSHGSGLVKENDDLNVTAPKELQSFA